MKKVLETACYEALLHSAGKTLFIIIKNNENTTDGAPGYEPTQRVPERDATGEINYYEEAPDTLDRLWREKLGRYLYDHVVKQDLCEQGLQDTVFPDQAILVCFPKHYSLWVHKKGNPHTPRRDTYLYGSRFVPQFRSPSEFCLHLKWILEGMPMRASGRPKCKCCYCDGSRTQGEISQEFGAYHPYRRDKGGRGGGKRGGSGTKPRDSTTIPYKDYTKLNRVSS